MAHDQDTLDDVIAIAELIARNGTPGELVNYLLGLNPNTFVTLFVATITADDLDLMAPLLQPAPAIH